MELPEIPVEALGTDDVGGVTGLAEPVPLLLGLLALAGKLAVLAAALAILETIVAKLRLFRVPELLAGSFALALLSVTAVFLVP